MTRQRTLKQKIRARMEKTGERYSTARARLLASNDEPAAVATRRPGVCPDTAALRNMLEQLGVRDPQTRDPITEALFTGLCGGVCFLYALFEYADTPPLLSILTRYDTAADQFGVGGLNRLGLGLEETATTSAAKAQKNLDAALGDPAAPTPVACIVDAGALAQPDQTDGATMGGAPTIVVIVGREEDHYLVDVGAAALRQATPEHLARARAAFKRGRHRQLVARAPENVTPLADAVDAAIADTVHRFDHAPYKGYASNFGRKGLRKWARLLVDERDAKGWPRVFADPTHAALALRRVYQGVEYEMTGPAAGRSMYADFLREAARQADHAAYRDAAEAFDQSAGCWSTLAAFVAECDVPAVRSGCDMLDDYMTLLDEQAGPDRLRASAADLASASETCDASPEAINAIFRDLAAQVETVADAEEQAFDVLQQARAGRV